jgi:hypothetical protein
MEDELRDPIEDQLRSLSARDLPQELRCSTLASVNRQLATSRWERRFVRATLILLLFGVSLNVRFGSTQVHSSTSQFASKSTAKHLIEVGVTVAEATDAETGTRFAHQMATLAGSRLTSQQVTALEQAIQKRAPSSPSSRKAG